MVLFNDSLIFRRFTAAALVAIFLIPTKATAAVSLNSACEWTAPKGLSGISSEQSFVVASLSKIFTTQWALQVLGHSYRYETKIYVEPLANGEVDIHIAGGNDPSWGRERMHHLVSELDRLGVQKIRSLTFDESFLLSWRSKASVIDKVDYYFDFTDLAGAETVFPSTGDVEKSLKTHFLPRKKEYENTLAKAKIAQVSMVDILKIQRPTKIAFRTASDFTPSATATTLRLMSLPLYQVLKLMNVTSNNYLADMLFEQLGGAQAFANYLQHSSLAPYHKSFNLKNGSGFPIKSGDNKFYNKASCAGVLASLQWIDNFMGAQSLGLEYVLPIAGTDPSTLDKYELPKDIMIAKTGTVNPTIALAGMILTQQGPLFFSQLVKTETNQDWPEARNLIREYLTELIQGEALPLQSQPLLPLFWAENTTPADAKPL